MKPAEKVVALPGGGVGWSTGKLQTGHQVISVVTESRPVQGIKTCTRNDYPPAMALRMALQLAGLSLRLMLANSMLRLRLARRRS